MKRLLVALAIGALFGCAAAATVPPNIAAAVGDPARPAADIKRDALRKPAEMLIFARVRPGMKVMDLIPVGGYFSRLFAKAVGPTGYVYAYEPVEYDMWDKDVTIKKVAADYANLAAMHFPIAKLTAPEPLDIVWTSQNYHDLYDPFMAADPAAVNKAVFAMLKPGGFYIILDHAAEPGSGTRDTDTLHRIDEARVKQDVLAAGFVLVGESKVLRNADDAHTAKVWDKTIRGHTDQFILKFRKPLR